MADLAPTDGRQLNGHNFGGEIARRRQHQLAMLTRENHARVECPHCRLPVAPSSLGRHVAVCHGDDL